MQRSNKHKDKLQDLVKIIKLRSYRVTKIGEYLVCFEEGFRIGDGSNDTEVFLGLGTDGVEVAVKRVCSKFRDFAEIEKEMMNSPRLTDSPHVLNYQFFFENKKYAYIITSLQEESLMDFLNSQERTLAELQNKGPTILRQILLGLRALHDDGILHRDLKPENALVNCEGNVVLADFGICRRLEPGQSTHYSVVRGTDRWRALESIPTDADCNRQPTDITVRYKQKSDIQTLGMVFYFVLTKGKHPFGKLTFDILSNVKRGESNLTGLTDADLVVAQDLIEWMLKHKLKERPTVQQCLKHPYVSEPEDTFGLLKAVGNEIEIKNHKMLNNNCDAVRELNQADSLTTPPWSEEMDEEVYEYFRHPANMYSNNGAELLRFIRNAEAHWPAPFLQRFGTPQAYFLNVFPTLPMIVHKILRKYRDWYERDTLKQFF